MNYQNDQQPNNQNKPVKPLRLFSDRDNKALLIENLPELLENNSTDHTIFFCTFVFENSRLSDALTDYRRFFCKFWSNINKETVSSVTKKDQFTKLILIPELSRNKDEMNFHHRHFHGHLFVPKRQLEKFNRNCVAERCLDLSRQKDRIFFQPDIISPFSKPNRILEELRNVSLDNKQIAGLTSNQFAAMNRAEFLKVRSHAVYQMNDCPSEFLATSIYSGKGFKSSQYAYDDALIYAKK